MKKAHIMGTLFAAAAAAVFFAGPVYAKEKTMPEGFFVGEADLGGMTKEEAEASKLIEDAKLLEEIGCFAVVLEKIPAKLAERVANELTIPVIGIGAGPDIDGQVLVLHDMLGLNKGFSPKFLRRYADLGSEVNSAVGRYIDDVKNGDFPNASEQY